MKKFLIAALPFLLLSFTILVNERTVKPFKWLEGSWTMTTKRGALIESWKTSAENKMEGSSKLFYKTGQERVMENLELVFENGKYYYISKVNNQNNNEPVWFTITSHSEKGFVAENPEHDFPKRITYELVNEDSIHAWIDGGPSMTDKKSDFYYSRIKD